MENVQFGEETKTLTPVDVNQPLPVPEVPAGQVFRGWQFPGIEGTYPTLTDDLLTTLNGQSPVVANPIFAYIPSGGSSSGSSSYSVSVDSNVKHGTVTATYKTASKGTTVTLTVKPDAGYVLETMAVTDKDGKEIKLTKKSDTQYTFTMPASKVTVKATFMEDNAMLNFFVDVPADAYYHDAVLWAATEGITGGTSATTFTPNATCTRAQAVTFLWRAAGSPAPKNHTMPFEDVAADAYYRDAVLWAVEQGITKGTSNTTFAPNATCTRAQIVTYIYRNEQAQGGGFQGSWMFPCPFTDTTADAYYFESVQWCVMQGITGGTTDTTFSPDSNCTRAQIVTFLYRNANR